MCITEGDKSIYALPYNGDGLSITYDLDYTQHTGIGTADLFLRVERSGICAEPGQGAHLCAGGGGPADAGRWASARTWAPKIFW